MDLVAKDLNSDAVNILVLEAQYYLSDDKIIDSLIRLVGTDKQINILAGSLNAELLDGREYLTLLI